MKLPDTLILILAAAATTGLTQVYAQSAEKILPEAADLTFGIEAGADLRITRWASSPTLFSPVAMDVDPAGRLWVIEDWHGRTPSEEDPRGGRANILILEDTDLDGTADRSHSFGPTFTSIPLGITVFDNRIVVSMAPELIVYTDVNRNAVFDEGIDRKEILLSGFEGHSHDHSLHGVVPGPNGQWYFSQGNCGMNVTGRDGRHIISSSYYSFNPQDMGKTSSDGYLYKGGLGLRMNPDGSGLEVFCQNTRNTHDMVVNSFGDIFHGDNDDPAHARASWVMEYSDFGYASLEDGSRSWEESAKSWEEGSVEPELLARRGDARASQSHWRENYPGTTPPDYIWGTGAPMGGIFIENNELGDNLVGSWLVCETVNKAIFEFRPQHDGAHIRVGPNRDFIRLTPEMDKLGFLPSDIIAGLDGSLFVSDWNSTNNRRGRGGPEGAIYRISSKSEKSVILPNIDFSTSGGLIDALKSPVPGIRWVAFEKLRQHPSAEAVLRGMFASETNKYFKARAMWAIAAQKSDSARKFLMRELESNPSEDLRICAFRAIKHFFPGDVDEAARSAGRDSSDGMIREVVLSVRDQPYHMAREIINLAVSRFDGTDRWFLEAIGTASSGKESDVYNNLVRPLVQGLPVENWDRKFVELAWRLRTPEALRDLREVLHRQQPPISEFRRLTMTYALAHSESERQQNLYHIEKLMADPGFAGDDYQSALGEILDKDLADMPAIILKESYVFPEKYTNTPTVLSSPEKIAALTGDSGLGEVKGVWCLTCHKVEDQGVSFGPNLTQWAKGRNSETIISAIVNPSETLAHGYEKAVILENNQVKLEGIDVGYSYHAGAVKVRTVGGQIVKVAFRKSGTPIKRLQNHSWMPSASQLGLSDQDISDIVAWLRASAGDRD